MLLIESMALGSESRLQNSSRAPNLGVSRITTYEGRCGVFCSPVCSVLAAEGPVLRFSGSDLAFCNMASSSMSVPGLSLASGTGI